MFTPLVPASWPVPTRQDAPPGSPAGQLLQSVAAELEAETTSEGRRLLLRRLVRKLHPDQNRGKDGGNRGKDGAEVFDSRAEHDGTLGVTCVA